MKGFKLSQSDKRALVETGWQLVVRYPLLVVGAVFAGSTIMLCRQKGRYT